MQYEKICEFSVIGKTSKRFREHFYTLYAECVKDTLNSSIENALEEEIRLDNGEKSVDMHVEKQLLHRCNNNKTNYSYKVISYQHITKEEKPCSQKHELVGTKKIYEEFDSKNVKIKVHSHDRNSSVSKFITTENPETVDTYDTWHAAKEVRKVMSKISKGPKKNIGQTWHPQLADKTAGVKTHFYWAMNNSNGNEDTLRFYLDNITAHYQNNHQNCHATSGCSFKITIDENAA